MVRMVPSSKSSWNSGALEVCTLRVRDWLAVLAAWSVTWAVKLKPPALMGVPLMTPVPDRLSPGGRLPAVSCQL